MEGVVFEIERFEHHSDRDLLLEILKGQQTIMADLSGLRAALSQLAVDTSSAATTVETAIASLGSDQSEIDALTAQVQQADADVQAIAAAAAAVIPAPPAGGS